MGKVKPRSTIDAHYILWFDQTVAVAHHVDLDTNNEFRGKLELLRTHPLLMSYWGWLHRKFYENRSDNDEFSQLPGFIFEKWSVEYPDGTIKSCEMPIPDAEYKTVTWRLRD